MATSRTSLKEPKRTRKSWREKLANDKGLPKVVTIDARLSKRWGATGTCVIPAPREVDALMRSVPRGRVVTINELRETLARRHDATLACPITTGIFSWIAAHAAAEAAVVGATKVTPYWRTLKNGGELNPKYPGGIAELRQRLKDEGHEIEARGKRWFVRNYKAALARLA